MCKLELFLTRLQVLLNPKNFFKVGELRNGDFSSRKLVLAKRKLPSSLVMCVVFWQNRENLLQLMIVMQSLILPRNDEKIMTLKHIENSVEGKKSCHLKQIESHLSLANFCKCILFDRDFLGLLRTWGYCGEGSSFSPQWKCEKSCVTVMTNEPHKLALRNRNSWGVVFLLPSDKESKRHFVIRV